VDELWRKSVSCRARLHAKLSFNVPSSL
jgi:hypothetical protein